LSFALEDFLLWLHFTNARVFRTKMLM